MFDILKKKISSFVQGIADKVSQKAREAPERPASTKVVEKYEPVLQEVPAQESQENKTILAALPAESAVGITGGRAQYALPEKKEIGNEFEVKSGERIQAPVLGKEKINPKPEVEAYEPDSISTPATQKPELLFIKTDQTERQIAPKLGIISKIRGIVTNEVTITDEETRGMFEELELALLESDVSPGTAHALAQDLRKRLVGKRVAANSVGELVKSEVASSISSVFHPSPDLVLLARDKASKKEVFCIMFLGPNGAGKTTTIAKLAKMFSGSGLRCVISASDTFRAAAIEQAGIHAQNLGVDLVKQAYGADPAAVAFDAVKHARAVGASVVLIDTAGRQETNRNLMDEMRKINRVVRPDFRVFVGEALSGHAVAEQVKAFDAAVGVDGIILTKLDCDTKGGNSVSIAHDAGKPIMFFGVGQEYGDLVPFDSAFVVRKVLEA